ncbi:MAG: leucine-rich repeat protein [Bacilli bacterium]|nr:leucine-rich repeat protein [Bacilli bacterium]
MSKKALFLFSILFLLSGCSSTTIATTTEALTTQSSVLSSTTATDTSDIVFSFQLDENNAIITGFSGSSENLIIPDLLDGHPVTTIAEEAFMGASQFTHLSLPDSLITIEDSAFKDCTGLLEVTIPDTVINLGRWAFENCSSLTKVTFGDGITSLKLSTFRYCSSIETVILPPALELIEDEVFSSNTHLTSITLPQTLTSIGRRAFSTCESLKVIYLGEGIETLGEDVFYDCDELIIYTSMPSAPLGWSSNWNPSNCLVLWSNEVVTIAFESNGGSAVQSIYSKYGASIDAPPNPTKLDYVFGGWFMDQEFTNPFVFSIMPENDLTLYANWQPPSIYQDTIDQIQALWLDYAAEATAESLVILNALYLAAIEAVSQAENQLAADIIYENFHDGLLLAFVRDYPKIDLSYAKSTAIELMEESTTLVCMLPDFPATLVLIEFIVLIDSATTILQVDDYLENFIVEIAEGIADTIADQESPPPIELIQAFKQASIGAVSGVYGNINGTSVEDMGFTAIPESYLNDLISNINSTNYIPDIVRYVFYGIRSMFQSLGTQSQVYFETEITQVYNTNRPTIPSEDLEAFDIQYTSAIANIQAMQFYEVKYLVYRDYIDS